MVNSRCYTALTRPKHFSAVALASSSFFQFSIMSWGFIFHVDLPFMEAVVIMTNKLLANLATVIVGM